MEAFFFNEPDPPVNTAQLHQRILKLICKKSLKTGRKSVAPVYSFTFQPLHKPLPECTCPNSKSILKPIPFNDAKKTV
jgi:hypothetical protein